MRSVYFQRPLEYQLLTESEEWHQGQRVRGSLRLKNIGTEALSAQQSMISLGHALKKDIKAGEANWHVYGELSLDFPELSSGQDHLIRWEMPLPSDCPITDKSGALHLLFGDENALEQGGRIDLQVVLHPMLQSFLQTFTTQFKFLEKYRKFSGGWTEIKLIPPDSGEFPSLDELLLNLKMVEERMELWYVFRLKGLTRDGESLKARRKKKEVEQALGADSYELPGGFPNRNLFRERIDGALAVARLGI